MHVLLQNLQIYNIEAVLSLHVYANHCSMQGKVIFYILYECQI